MSEIDTWVVRPLTAADAAARRELRLEALRDFPTAYGSTYEIDSTRPMGWFAWTPPAEDGLFVGAFLDAQLIGTAGIVRFDSPTRRHWGHIVGMYVRPSHWGTSMAEEIVTELLKFASGRFELIELSATAGNVRAERFYGRLGFREFGRRPRSMRHGAQDHDEIMMWRAV